MLQLEVILTAAALNLGLGWWTGARVFSACAWRGRC